MIDVRDEALGALLDGAAAGIESAPVDRLPEVLRRGTHHRTTRFTAIAVGVAVFVGAVSWAGLLLPAEDAVIPANVADWRTFASLQENGWTIQVPPPWRIQELPSCPNAPERIGVIVTNTDFEFLNPRGESPQCGDRFVFQGFPSDGVAFAFMPVGIRFGSIFRQPDTVFPLSPDQLTRTDSLSGGAAESFLGIWREEVNLAFVRRWVGPQATGSDIAALDRMLSSLRLKAEPEWIATETSKRGLRLQMNHPPSFEVTTYKQVLVEDAPDPILRLASASVGSRRCGSRLWWELGVGFVSLGRGSVVVVVSDATQAWSADYDRRPERFGPSSVMRRDRFRCQGRSFELLEFGFEESGRQILVEVATTQRVLDGTKSSVIWRILDSIRIAEA